MPAAIVAVAAGAAATVATGWAVGAGLVVAGGIGASIIGAVASTVVGSVLSSALTPSRQDTQQQTAVQAATGVQVNAESQSSPLYTVYGETRIGGTRMVIGASGTNNEYLHLIVAHCEGEVYAAPTLYIGDLPYTDGKFDGLIHWEFFTGADDQQVCQTLLNAGVGWKATSRGRGVAYSYVRLKYKQEAFSGIPQITVKLRGRIVFDPRSNARSWSANPALCLRDYLINPRFGRGIPLELIDETYIISAANTCDSTYTDTGGTSRKLHTCNGVTNPDTSTLENVRGMMTTCRGRLVYSARGYSLIVDKARASTFAFTPDNIVGAWSISLPGKRTMRNKVVGAWVNPDDLYKEDLYPAESTAFRALDNGVMLESRIELPFTQNTHEAQMLCERELRQSRIGIQVSFRAFMSALKCEVGDVVTITHYTPGWTAKPFDVTRITLLSDDEVQVDCREYDSIIYDTHVLTAQRTTYATLLPDPQVVPTFTGLTAASGMAVLQKMGDGTIISRIKLEWPEPTNIYLDTGEVEIQYKELAATRWHSTLSHAMTSEAFLSPVKDTIVYNIRARWVNEFRRRGAWQEITHTVIGKTEPPSNVATLTATVVDGQIRVQWSAIADVDVAEYELRLGGTSWANSTYVGKYRTLVTLLPPTAGASLLCRVKAIDTTQHYSVADKTVTLTIAPPSAPALTPRVVDKDVFFAWSAATAGTFPVQRYELRRGATFATATVIAKTDSLAASYYESTVGTNTYWIVAIDTAGNYGTAASVTATTANVSTFAGLTAESGTTHLLIRGDGSIASRIKLAWTIPSIESLILGKVEIQSQKSGATTWISAITGSDTGEFYLSDVQDAISYNIRARWVNQYSRSGAFQTISHTVVGKTAPPSNVTGFVATLQADRVILAWTPVGDADLAEYEVRQGSSWASSTFIGRYRTTEARIIPNFTGGVTWRVKAIDTTGNYSATDAAFTLTVVPPVAPTLTVKIADTAVSLSWTAVAGTLPTKLYEVRRGDTFAAAAVIGTVSALFTTIFEDLPNTYRYWVRAQDVAGNWGAAANIAATPAAIPTFTGLTAASGTTYLQLQADGTVVTRIRVGWTPPASESLVKVEIQYQLEEAAKWVTAINDADEGEFFVANVKDAEPYLIRARWVNSYNRSGAWQTLMHVVTGKTAPPSNVTGFGATVGGDRVILTWASIADADLSEYEVRQGSSWETATLVGKVKATTIKVIANFSGSRTWLIKAIDTTGNYSTTATSASITVVAPPAPPLRQQVIDNNVLLFWTEVAGTLPTATYEIRKGSSWATAENVGRKSGAFTTIFEIVAGTYTYWIAAVDIAGNIGTPSSVTASVSQPPDYIFYSKFQSAFAGTKTNCKILDGGLTLPVNTPETWASHFTSRAWSTIQNQIDAGYAYFLQPVPTSATYTEVIDYGTVLPSFKATILLDVYHIVAGTTLTVSLSTSLDGVTYSTPIASTSAFFTNFRYLKISVAAASSDSKKHCRINSMTVQLDVKRTVWAGNATCNAADAGGTVVYLTKDGASTGEPVFIDVTGITIGVNSLLNITPVYDFVDTPYPTQFKVLLFNSATGARVSGNISYTATGVLNNG